MHPVVVRPRQLDGPVLADDLAVGEAAGGVEDGLLHAKLRHEIDPAIDVYVGEGAGDGEVLVGGVEVVGLGERVSADEGRYLYHVLLRVVGIRCK